MLIIALPALAFQPQALRQNGTPGAIDLQWHIHRSKNSPATGSVVSDV